MNDIQKAQRARILSCYGETPKSLLQKSEENDLEKGGEGSKGGKIVGHTKSGKPVYEKHQPNHEDYKDFTSQDHKDASDLHVKAADSVRNVKIPIHHDRPFNSHFKRAFDHDGRADIVERKEKKSKKEE